MFGENILKLVEARALFQDVILDCALCLQIQLLLLMFDLFHILFSAIGGFPYVFVNLHHIC